MNLKNQLSSGTGMTKFLAGKQISPSATLNLACNSLMIRKYQRNSKNSTYIEKIGKNKFDLEFKNEIEEEINFVLELNQAKSSEIFYNINHIKASHKKLKFKTQLPT